MMDERKMSDINEAALCKDCGVDTALCTGRRGCRHKGKRECYMVHDHVWKAASMTEGFLCVACLEARLGRRLHPGDFTNVHANDPTDPWHTSRLAMRLRRGRDVKRQTLLEGRDPDAAYEVASRGEMH